MCRHSVGKSIAWFIPRTASAGRAVRRSRWVVVDVQEQRVGLGAQRSIQLQLLRLRLSCEVESLDAWNAELVVDISPDSSGVYLSSPPWAQLWTP